MPRNPVLIPSDIFPPFRQTVFASPVGPARFPAPCMKGQPSEKHGKCVEKALSVLETT